MHNQHIPVLLEEVISFLAPRPRQVIVDATFGFGGHAIELAQKVGAQGKVVGIEQDERTLKEIDEKLKSWPQITLLHGNFAQISKLLQSVDVTQVDAVLLDLGVSSFQLDEAGYGLSWRKNEPLDMRLSGDGESALELLHSLSEKDLADVLYQNADEYRSRRIAKAIKQNIGSIKTTQDLAKIVESAVGGRGKIHAATKTFQALRMAVNEEVGNLEKFFAQVQSILKPGGKLAVISFHSGEDRIVKNNFKKTGWQVLTKKPVRAQKEEMAKNPRSRSALLRVAQKV